MIRLLTAVALLLLLSAQAAPAMSAHQRIAAARIVAAARAQVDTRLGAGAAKAQVSVVGVPEDVTVPPGKVRLDAGPLAGRWPRARVGVPVSIAIDDRVVRTATVWFALSVHRDALAYAADAAAGTPATALALVPKDTDVAQISGELVGDAAQLAGLRLRHPVLTGTTATLDDFERIPDVDRQQRVRVLVAAGTVRLQTMGTALGPGDMGHVLSVQVDGAQSPVRAQVTGKGVVSVTQ